jgi:hypothetical protein
MTRRAQPRTVSVVAVLTLVLTLLVAHGTWAQQTGAGRQATTQSARASVPPEDGTPRHPWRSPVAPGDALPQVAPVSRSRSAKAVSAYSDTVSFSPVVLYPSDGSGSTTIAVGDLNGDGNPDVVVANCIASHGSACEAAGTVGVLLGNGDGTLQPVVTYDSGGFGATSIAIGDVNGDGKPDLIVANYCPASECPRYYHVNGVVSVLLGNGDGTFQPAVSYDAAGIAPGSVAVADLTGNGKLDIVVANYESTLTGVVAVLLGNGDGTFQPATTYGAEPQSATWLAVTDVNGDGKPDVVVAYQCDTTCSTGGVGVLLGNGDGTFQSPVIYPSGGTFSYSVAAADVNGDGKPDLVVTNIGGALSSCNAGVSAGDGSVGVLLNNGDGTFRPALCFDSGGQFAFSVATADINGDGKPDLLVANDDNGTIGLLLGNGDGTFQTAATYDSGWPGADSVVVADLRSAGRLDVLAGGRDPGNVGVLLDNGSSPESATTITASSSASSSVYGQAVTFTAQVAASPGTPTGTVVLFDGSALSASGPVKNGVASIADSVLPVGVNSITAEYTGGGGFASSKFSTPLTVTVVTASTTTAVASSINPAYINQLVTFTATVTSQYGGAATGSVVFYSGSKALGTASLSGNTATLTTSFSASGSYSISATYGATRTISAAPPPFLPRGTGDWTIRVRRTGAYKKLISPRRPVRLIIRL